MKPLLFNLYSSFPLTLYMSESIIDNDIDDKSDLIQTSSNLLSNINYKLFVFMYLFGMLIFSDIFIENFLSRFNDTIDGENTTTKGTMIQLLMFCIAMIVLDLLIKYKCI